MGFTLVSVFTRVSLSHPVKCGRVFVILQICDQMINLKELRFCENNFFTLLVNTVLIGKDTCRSVVLFGAPFKHYIFHQYLLLLSIS